MQHLRCEEGHIHKVMWLLSLPPVSAAPSPPPPPGCSSVASQFMGMTTLIGSLFVCKLRGDLLMDGAENVLRCCRASLGFLIFCHQHWVASFFLLHSSRWAGASVRWEWGAGKMDLDLGMVSLVRCISGTSRCALHLPVATQRFCLHLKMCDILSARLDFDLACASQRCPPPPR